MAHPSRGIKQWNKIYRIPCGGVSVGGKRWGTFSVVNFNGWMIGRICSITRGTHHCAPCCLGDQTHKKAVIPILQLVLDQILNVNLVVHRVRSGGPHLHLVLGRIRRSVVPTNGIFIPRGGHTADPKCIRTAVQSTVGWC